MAGIAERCTGLIIRVAHQHVVGMTVGDRTVTACAVAGSHRYNRGRCDGVVSVYNTKQESGGGIMAG